MGRWNTSLQKERHLRNCEQSLHHHQKNHCPEGGGKEGAQACLKRSSTLEEKYNAFRVSKGKWGEKKARYAEKEKNKNR